MSQRVAIITGSTSGIGLAIAKHLASRGVHIVLNGLGDQAVFEKLAEDISNQTGVRAIYHPANMLNADQIKDLVEVTFKQFGRVDILVNNAGIQHVEQIDTFPKEKWDQIIGINLSSAFHTIKNCMKIMKDQKFGRIINIASAHGLVASPFKSAYVAAKHGIVGLTKVVALEGAEHNVTCNAICPGYVETDLVKNQIADTAKARGITPEQVVKDVMLKPQPTKRFVTIEQIAEMVEFLSGDNAYSMTGSAIPIDGGWTAH